jgi:hypothetical protein
MNPELGQSLFVSTVSFDTCDVTLSVYPHWASLKNMHGHVGKIMPGHLE